MLEWITMRKMILSIIVVFVMLFCLSCSDIDDPAQSPDETTVQAEEPTRSEATDTEKARSDTTEDITEENLSDDLVPKASLINGVELAEFAIVYSDNDLDYSKRAAAYIQTKIRERTGLALALIEDDDESDAEYEIVVGETSRSISARLDADTEKTQFAILAEDKQIAIEGDRFVIAAASYFFIETYVPQDDFSAQIPNRICIHEPIVQKAENFIMLIGDGMGLYQTLLFDVLENSEVYGDGEDIFYGYYLTSFGLARTRSLSGTTDSAAAGTALSCGVKTYNGYIGQDGEHNNVKSITELAAELGRSVAVMSTEASTGATPAAFSAHANDRSDSDDILAGQSSLIENYGALIECDFNHYTEEGIKLIEARINQTLEILDDDPNGFFLMYEEAHIDKHCHNKDIENAYRAVIRFNQIIATVMEYAFYHPDTFVLITADHETGKLLPSGAGGYAYNTSNHSSHYVPVFAYGDGCELFDDIIMENIQIPQTVACFMGAYDFGDKSEHSPLVDNRRQ